MFIDALSLPDGTELEADVVIAGGGAAGISLARRLSAAGVSVVLLESGGHEFDAATQALALGENSGADYWALDTARLRYFGGTTNHWTGWCRPLDPHDFEKRPWVQQSGWPLSRADLDPYYRQAHELCELGEFNYDPKHWAEKTKTQLLPLDETPLLSTLWQLSTPTRFGPKYRESLLNATNVRVVLHTNVVALENGQDEKVVQGVTARTLSGISLRVKARATVLALGGLDNARMLLIGNGGRPGGIGNDHGLVGRYFADHPHSAVGILLCNASQEQMRLYQDVVDVGRPAAIQASLGIKPEVLKEQRLLGFSAILRPVTHEPPYPAAQAKAVAALWDGQKSKDVFPLELFIRTEQLPDAESRLTLSSKKDALGVPKLKLHWHHHSQTLDSIKRGVELLAGAFGQIGLGRVHSYIHAGIEVPGAWPEIAGGNHHIGTTRMAEDPKQGVVDPHCKVFGMENLFVAGSSVYPTTGYANPTLTLVALALRLGDHLAKTLS
ncbi:MAG: GMC family oxidoreductase [Polyangiaceae bacterium]|nr:GMC family oxidoreductase [Polyangiaceae bacterium]